jgi:hypothetical protein
MHGREIDMMESVKPSIPHMLGITPLNKTHDPANEEMSLLDTKHPFWSEYQDDIQTRREVTEKIETAIRSLKEDDIFRMTYPYGEEAEIIYVEVDTLETTENNMLQTSCKECHSPLTADLLLTQTRGSYQLSVSLDCDECGFSKKYARNMIPE